jgi:hypothetical protein
VLIIALLSMAAIAAFQPSTTITLGSLERDLTGDKQPEILRVVAVGPTHDNLDVTFTIESAGRTLCRFKLAPLTRTVGFDAGRHVVSSEEHRARIKEFGQWFFADEKFLRPEEFVDSLRREAPGRVAEIPDVIARDRQASDTVPGSVIWQEIQSAPITIFTFSPGGDAIVAIGWSARAGRFYRLLECC